MIKKFKDYLLEKNRIIKLLAVAGAIVLISPILTNFLNTFFNFGDSWTTFVSILIILTSADYLAIKFLGI